jgi:pimeloyl-ACP methyl ester carboxylesterase
MPMQRLRTGIDLYYERHGQGEPLVLIPGTGFSADVWLPDQVPELSRSLEVIVFDPRGVGRSSHPAGVYTVEQMSADVVDLLDQLEFSSAHVLGHSMGGRIGLAMALDFPGRVRSLILAASGSGPAAPTAWPVFISSSGSTTHVPTSTCASASRGIRGRGPTG